MYQKITETINNLPIDTISENRKAILNQLISIIQSKVNSGKLININFICTHNSRRSHLSQVWAQTMAHFYTCKNVYCYSGGTEATALFPSAAKALEASGFLIEQLSTGLNPIYAIKYDETIHPVIGFSKTYDTSFNPESNFLAIMTCSSADENCPFIPGAEARIPLTYEDPKAFDNTPQQADKYLERSLQIASEIKYVFSMIN